MKSPSDSHMDVLHPTLLLLSFVFFAFVWFQLGRDINRLLRFWLKVLKDRSHFLSKGVHHSLPVVLAIYLSSLVTLILFTYTMRHEIDASRRAYVTDGFVFLCIVLCHVRTGIVFSERGNLLRVCTPGEQVVNAGIWLALFAGILFLLKDLIRYPDTYYIVITLVGMCVTLAVMRWRNVKKDKYPDRAGLLKSKRVTLFRTISDDEL